MAKFVSFDRLKRYTQHVKSYVGQQILNAKGEWAKQLNLKVDKVEGKGLSTNDFTTELKNKLNDIEAGAQVNTVTGIKGNAESTYRKGDVNLTPANIGAVASSNGDASNTKVTFTQSTSRVNLTSGDTLKTAFGKLSKWFVDLKAVAFSGSYNDLANKPTTLKNPKSLTIQQNGGNQTEYDGSTALTVNVTKAGIGLGNVENKSSATIRNELTSANVTKALGFTPISKVTVDSALSSSSTNPVQNKVINAALYRKLTKAINEYNTETICLCTHSKSGTVHTLVNENSNDYYFTVKFVATADFTYGDTFRFGSASSSTVVTPKTEDGELLNTGAFKKGSVVIACTGDTAETVNTLFFKGGGGLSDAKLAAADAEPGDVRTGKKFYAGDKTIKTGTMPNQGAKTAALNAGGSYTIPQGYHNGSGVVKANSLASQTQANAENGDIISGKTAWVNGSKRTGTLQDLGYEPKGTGCTLYNGGVYIYFGDPSSRYALSRSVWYPQGDIKNILSFAGSGSGNKNGGETDIHRDGNNIVAKGYTVSSASARISGKTVTVNVHAHFRLNNNGNVNVPNGDLSSVDYSFSFNIG